MIFLLINIIGIMFWLMVMLHVKRQNNDWK